MGHEALALTFAFYLPCSAAAIASAPSPAPAFQRTSSFFNISTQSIDILPNGQVHASRVIRSSMIRHFRLFWWSTGSCTDTRVWGRPSSYHFHFFNQNRCGGASRSLALTDRETVIWHSLDIAKTHADRQQASFLHNVSLGLFPSLISMLSQLNDQPFGMPSSLPQHQPGGFTFHPNSKNTR